MQIKKHLYNLLSASMAMQIACSGMTAFPSDDIAETVSAAAVSTETTAYSTGKYQTPAILRGDRADIVYDDALQSNVLALNGDAFGSGWLQLPAFFETDCTDGFTFSLKFRLDSSAEDYTRLFQFSSIPFGTGAVPYYDSPDISIDLFDSSAYRSSLFAGNNTDTVNDGRHRAIGTLSAVPDSAKWHQFTAVYAPGQVRFYLDGAAVSNENTADFAAAADSLFSEDLLSSYIYNAIGHSVYTDHDLKARIDDIAFYSYALTEAQAQTLPQDAAYLYTFEPETVQDGSSAAAETTVSATGQTLTSIPSLETASSDGTLSVKFWHDTAGRYYYSVHKTDSTSTGTVIEPSALGLITATEDLSSGFAPVIPSAAEVTFDEQYAMPVGKHSQIRNHYREISFPLQKGDSILTVIFRLYDDGVGFRYALNHGAEIREETSEIMFPENGQLWGSAPNATYEWEIGSFSVRDLTAQQADYSIPLLGRISDRYWVLLSEANVFNEASPYCADFLKTDRGSRAFRWRFGNKVRTVNMTASFHTPWRTAIIADNLNDMACSDLILNLNPPSVISDTSWIRPGKTAWSWWSSGGDSPIEYHTQKDYIDFAAENGWEFVCLDFGWALWDHSAEKVRELCEYGAERGVGIYLWYGVNNVGHSMYRDSEGHAAYPYYSLLDEATIVREFERIRSLGVQGVKVDYYESDTQETMRQMYLCMDIAAQNHLMVLFHGCTMPHGESRTYPNVVSYEAVYGAEYYKWRDTPSLTNRITYPFTRNVVGSADFTPTGTPIDGIRATAGFALSDVVTLESGIQHFAQSVYTYEGDPALPFLNDVPVV